MADQPLPRGTSHDVTRLLVASGDRVDTRNAAAERSLSPSPKPFPVANERGPDLVAVDEALATLPTIDPRKARTVEMRFGGLTVEETAALLKLSPQTVMRDWKSLRRGCLKN